MGDEASLQAVDHADPSARLADAHGGRRPGRPRKQGERAARHRRAAPLARPARLGLLLPGRNAQLRRAGAIPEGAFRLAIEAGVDVVPLALAGTEAGLPKHSIVFAPTTATLTVLPPVSTAGWTAPDAPRLAETIRGMIARALEEDERSL